ncbi:hypothetical protein SCHPADRAFT_933068 [Schizopora paradoxa]|uniref:Uncharacterized protein n=1 Tax=Schizopora paradoxa TaxID=27342 RepID=A0A0H2RAE7_9AGAM|nr:hypothetical protein SCHPADRAFT_933068 [Schizopora paradoxa]
MTHEINLGNHLCHNDTRIAIVNSVGARIEIASMTNLLPVEGNIAHEDWAAFALDVNNFTERLQKIVDSGKWVNVSFEENAPLLQSGPNSNRFSLSEFRLRCAIWDAYCWGSYKDVTLLWRNNLSLENIHGEQARIVVKWTRVHIGDFIGLEARVQVNKSYYYTLYITYTDLLDKVAGFLKGHVGLTDWFPPPHLYYRQRKAEKPVESTQPFPDCANLPLPSRKTDTQRQSPDRYRPPTKAVTSLSSPE